jgi:hypothetical protein
LIALLLLGIGLPLCAVAEEQEAYLERPHVEAAEEEIEAPEQHLQSDGKLFPVQETDDGKGGEDVEDEEEDEEELEKPTVIDTTHETISSGVLVTARWLDHFFADPRTENESSETRVRVRFSVFAEEDDAVEYNVRANLHLDLPILEERLQLVVAGDPDDVEEDFRTISGREGERPELTSADDDFSTSLRYFLIETLERNVSLRAGVRWRDGLPIVFLEPRYRQSVPLDSWLFRFTQRLIGSTDGETGVRTTFDFDRELKRPFFFRTTLDGSWTSEEDGYFYDLAFQVFQRFSPRRVIIYSWGNFFRTRPHHQLDNVVLSARYRQRILRDWLFYEVIPQVSFPDERDRDATPGILLRLEMLFGHYPKLPPPPE